MCAKCQEHTLWTVGWWYLGLVKLWELLTSFSSCIFHWQMQVMSVLQHCQVPQCLFTMTGKHTWSLWDSMVLLRWHASPHRRKGCCGSWVWRFQPITELAQGFGPMEAHQGGNIWQGICGRNMWHIPFTAGKQKTEGAGQQWPELPLGCSSGIWSYGACYRCTVYHLPGPGLVICNVRLGMEPQTEWALPAQLMLGFWDHSFWWYCDTLPRWISQGTWG